MSCSLSTTFSPSMEETCFTAFRYSGITTKNILDKVGWFEEDYFLDGEDIDLSWKIKNLGYKIVYYPEVSIVHIKGATKGKNRKSKKYISFNDKLKYRLSGVDSMEMFYRKRLWDR
ncbi:MAG: Glycosyl transferase, family 2 [Candidatus Nomurabacteria bacterium GW2011_GWC2_35_8]|uniref:Glycosyl transferase, family 2 n=1 Tax=Candidatus Nomurabacteria bacterium GW2011_GWC2_35_8 TaxID=1618752 RepID=A0A0G0FJI2_9BACT|nr:MAG: Glycosyl transferase, family 2 [Candidatus Nomurabacteria bacterium GW2011_GWC2_35_8]